MSAQKNDYTLMLVPEGNGKVFRLRLTARRLRRLIYTVGFLAIVGAVTTIHTIYTVASLPQRWQFEEQMLEQQMHLSDMSTRLQSAEDALGRVAKLDRNLRFVLGKGGKNDNTLTGMGGPTPERRDRFDSLQDPDARLTFARLDARVRDVAQSANRQELALYDLDALMADQLAQLASTPSIWPTRGWVTSNFGSRVDPFTGRKKMHEGLDIATQHGNPVAATADGVVLFAGVKSGYGKVVILDHGYGIVSRYGHLSSIDVRAGQLIDRGSLLGRVGSTGRSTGPHLHYEVRVAGAPVNPYRYILIEDRLLP